MVLWANYVSLHKTRLLNHFMHRFYTNGLSNGDCNESDVCTEIN